MLTKLFFLLLFLLLGARCAGVSPPSSLSPQAKATILNIESMTLLPIISDVPLPTETSQKVLTTVHDRVALDLAFKGYVLEKAAVFSEKKTFTPEEVSKMSIEEVSLLGPQESQFLVLCFLKELDSSFFVLVQSATAGISAMIIDKRRKSVIWKNEDSSSSTAGIFLPPGGLLGMLVTDEEGVSIASSVRRLFSTIPEKPMN